MTDHSVSQSDGAAQRRRTARHKLFEPIALSVRGQAIRAHLLDLSSTGALAHSETPPPLNAFVTINASGVTAMGRVMWISSKRFGVQFSEPLSETMMNALIEGC